MALGRAHAFFEARVRRNLPQAALDLMVAQPLDRRRARMRRVVGMAAVDAQRAAVRRNLVDVEQPQAVMREDLLDRAERQVRP